MGTTGFAADSRAVAATAVGAKAALFIWKFSEEAQQWTVYRVGPKGALKHHREIWLSLRKEHHGWLKPRATAGTSAKIDEMKERALQPPSVASFLEGCGSDKKSPAVSVSNSEENAWTVPIAKQGRQQCEENAEPWFSRSKVSEPAESVLAALGFDGDSECERHRGRKAQERVAKSVFFEKGDLYKCL